MSFTKRLLAEALGTFWLVFGGTGSAVLAAAFPKVGIGLLGVAFAFGLTLLTMAYAIGNISGCHINPAVTVGFATSGRFPWEHVLPYVIVQVIGAIAASALLYAIATGSPSFSMASGFAANGYGAHSPGHYSMVAHRNIAHHDVRFRDSKSHRNRDSVRVCADCNWSDAYLGASDQHSGYQHLG